MNLVNALIALESGGRNVVNTSATTSSGQAQGYFQITTGTWRDFAPAAGVDLAAYPTPLSAPYDVQSTVANSIPLNRWDPKTIAGLQAQGFSLIPSATLGQNVAVNELGAVGFEGPQDTSSGAAAGSNYTGGTLADLLNFLKLPTYTEGLVAGATGASDKGGLTGAVDSVTGAVKSIATIDWQTWFVRGGLVLLGVVIITVGIVALLWEHGGKQAFKSAMEVAA